MSIKDVSAQVPLGWVEVRPGVRLPVFINPPWQRMLGEVPSAIDNVAGTNAVNIFMTPDGGDSNSEEMVMIPGPQGPPGANGIQYIMLVEETQSDDVYFIPR